jgi:hypothetical protein
MQRHLKCLLTFASTTVPRCSPDNLDVAIPPVGGSRDTGFKFTFNDAVDFANWLADAAHSFGMGFGLKNVKGEAARLHGLVTYAWCHTSRSQWLELGVQWCR